MTPTRARLAGPAAKTRTVLVAGPALAIGLMPDLRHPEAAVDLSGMHHDVDEQVQQGADVVSRQVAAALGVANQQGQLLEGEGGGIRTHRGDRARVAGIGISEDLEKVCSKLHVRTRVEAVAMAVRNGLTEVDE